MSAKYRVILCLVSVALAYGGVAISGAGQPAEKLFHRWYAGVLTMFLVFFFISMFLTLRGRIVRSIWVIPISAALSYPAAIFAYVTYFAVFEPQRFFSSLTHIQRMPNTFGFGEVFDVIAMLFVGPTVTFAWLFGAIAGAVFFLLGRTLQTGSTQFH
jgi:hypothetical protein